MGEYINKKVQIDPDTGEVLDEKYWLGYDRFFRKRLQIQKQRSIY